MNQKVIDLLNQARSAELGAISQYMIHHYELEDKDFGKLAAKIKQFIQFLEKYPEEKVFFASRFKHFMEEGGSRMAEKKGGKGAFTLKDLKPGKKGKVIKIKVKGDLKKRLLDMGIVPGAEVQLERIAPLGDPIDILIKGYHLSLRKNEAKDILITRS